MWDTVRGLGEPGKLTREEVIYRLENRFDPEGRVFVDMDLTELDLSNINFSEATFTRTRFSGAMLEECTFESSTFNNCSFYGTKLDSSQFINCVIRYCNFQASYLRVCRFTVSEVSDCVFKEADLSGFQFGQGTITASKFERTKLTGAGVSGSLIGHCSFRDVDMTFAAFDSATFTDCKAVSLQMDRSRFTNSSILRCNWRNPGLSFTTWNSTNLRQLELFGGRFFDVDFAHGLGFDRVTFDGSWLSSEQIASLKRHNPSIEHSPSHTWGDGEAVVLRAIRVSDVIKMMVRVEETPLTLKNVTTIFDSLQTLYTSCRLLSENRMEDFVDHATGKSPWMERATPLTILSMSYNSPAEIGISIDTKIGKTLEEAIDAVNQAGGRRRGRDLQNLKSELESKQLVLETEFLLRRREQDLSIDLARQQLEAEKQKLELEKSRLAIEREQLQLEMERARNFADRLELSMETARRLVAFHRPELTESELLMAARLLAPAIMKLDEGQAFSVVLAIAETSSQSSEE